MQRSALPLLRQLQRAGAEAVESTSTRSFTSLGNFSFASTQDAPLSSQAKNINVKATASGKAVEVTVSAGGATAKARYSAGDLRKQAANALMLKDAARISVLHSSALDYLVKLVNERYQVLAQWPDFTTAYGKDFYYRAHPEDLKKFYAAVDEFHRIYDVLTEFDSLNSLVPDMLAGYKKRRMNTIHPTVGPSTANSVVTQFLLAHAK